MKKFYILHRLGLSQGGMAMCDVATCDDMNKILSVEHLDINEGLRKVDIDWGYVGLASSELAYHILRDYVGWMIADNLYTTFMMEMIVPVPVETTFRVIAGWQIEKFLTKARNF